MTKSTFMSLVSPESAVFSILFKHNTLEIDINGSKIYTEIITVLSTDIILDLID